MSEQLTDELSSTISSIEPSLTMSITALANRLKSEGKDVIGFGAGEPDFDTPEPIKEAAIQAIRDGHSKYTPAAGLPQLKDAIIGRIQSDYGLSYDRSEVVVSCGAKHSLHNAFLVLLNSGDEVILPGPYWVSYPEQIRVAGGKVVEALTSVESDFKVTVDQLDALKTTRTKVLLLNSPSNPTGTVYNREELLAIAEWAASNDIWIISDEIYDKLIYGDQAHVCLPSLSDAIKQKTVLVNGVSKTYAMTGYRIGYFVAASHVVAAVSRLQSHTTSNPTSIAQYAAIEALTMDQSIISEMREIFNRRRLLMIDCLSEIPGMSINNPNGAFYAFPKIDGLFGKTTTNGIKLTNSLIVCEALLEDVNVACVPGIGFGAEGYMRLSYATSDENIVNGLSRIKEWVSTLQ